MRIALISDIHGNTLALDAVLADCRAAEVEHFWFLGDYAAIGPDPAGVLERIAHLPNARFIRGNTDRYVVRGEGPPPSLELVHANPRLAATYAAIRESFAWTRGYVVATGWFDWLELLPLEFRFSAPDGTRILAVHAAPGTDDGEGVHPGRSNAELRELVEGCAADLLFVAHTHEAMVRRVGDVEIVNLGALSNPRSGDLRASYVLLELGATVSYRHRRVAYDHAAFSDIVRRSKHPAAEYIISFQRGEQHARPVHPDHIALPS